MVKGENVTDVLLDVCTKAGVSAGAIRMQGVLSSVELAVFDSNEGEYVRTFAADGDLEMLSVEGNISRMGPQPILNAHVTLAYAEHGQNRVVGGQLRSGTAYSVEFVIEAFDDVTLERTMDESTRLPTWSRMEMAERQDEAADEPDPEPAEQPKEKIKPAEPAQLKQSTAPKTKPALKRPSADDWKAAADQAQSKLSVSSRNNASIDESGDFDAVELEPGDMLIHPRLGDCQVVRVEDDVAAYIRLPKSRRISKLALDLVRLEWVEERDKKNVYKVHAASR